MSTPRPENCPPDDARAVDQSFFRLVDADLAEGATPGAEDWLLPHEKKSHAGCSGKTDVCMCHAHSLIGDLTDANTFRSLIPAFKKKRIAEVAVRADMGVVKATPRKKAKSHHSWWPEPVDLVPDATVLP